MIHDQYTWQWPSLRKINDLLNKFCSRFLTKRGTMEHMNKILVIEDEFGIKDLLSDIFSVNCEVDSASNVNEADEMLKKNNYKVIISDYFLEDANCIQVFNKNKEQIKNSKIFIITGHPPHELTEPREDLIIQEIINKPLKFEEFIPKILRLLNE